MPIGLIAAPVAMAKLRESFGPDTHLDLPGLVFVAVGLFGLVYGIVRGNEAGWTSPEILTTLIAGLAFLAVFVWWESRATFPMLPLRLLRIRGVAVANAVSGCLYFGMFGAVFFLAQFLQTVQGDSAFEAGLKVLPWTIMPMFIAPLAGAMSDRVGARPLMAAGLLCMALSFVWMGLVISPAIDYLPLALAFTLAGFGMALVFAPVANMVVGSVRDQDIAKTSGTNNTVREVSGALGIAVMTAIFTGSGSYASGQTFVAGLNPAVLVGALVLFVGSLIALLAPRRITPPPLAVD